MRRDPVGPGQESVRDYPRPPSAQVTDRHVVVEVAGRVLADTRRAVRVCETSHPPVYSVPREDVVADLLERAPGRSVCERKGTATTGTPSSRAGGSRRSGGPTRPPRRLRAPALGDRLPPRQGRPGAVGREQTRPQPGGFYGGWITDEIAGPVNGGPGSLGW